VDSRGQPYAGSDPAAINPVSEQLLRNLAPNQRPVLRIGGDSTDGTWWPVQHLVRPHGVKYSISSRSLAVTRALAEGIGGRLILGVNLEAKQTRMAVAEGKSAVIRHRASVGACARDRKRAELVFGAPVVSELRWASGVRTTADLQPSNLHRRVLGAAQTAAGSVTRGADGRHARVAE